MKVKFNTYLEALFVQHYKEWCLLAYSYLGNSTEAEEVVQDVCVKVLVKEKSGEISNLEGYIFKAIQNNCLKQLKRKQRFENLSEVNNIVLHSAEENLIQREKINRLQQAIEALPEQCKIIFKRCVVEGQKYEIVADSMGVSINTVKYHVKNAYKTLRLIVVKGYILVCISFLFS